MIKVTIPLPCLGSGSFHSPDLLSALYAYKAQISFVVTTELPWMTREIRANICISNQRGQFYPEFLLI